MDPDVAGSSPVDRPIYFLMTSIQAFILGLIQGLTEFLPVSSSAHLKITKLLLDLKMDDSQVIFDLCCHFGTLIALFYYFGREIFYILRYDPRQIGRYALGTLPLIPFYFLLKPLRESASQSHLLGFCMIITALLLFLGGWVRRKKRGSPLFDSLAIGTMQAAALIPGVSRSGATISTAQMLGWEPYAAVHFSFLLSVPAVLGGTGLEILKLVKAPTSFSIPLTSCAIGFITSLGIGLLIVKPAMRFLEKGNLRPFAWYCLIAGIMVTLIYG